MFVPLPTYGRFRSPVAGEITEALPRSMQVCVPFSGPDFCNLSPARSRWPVNRGSGIVSGLTEAGQGAKFSGGTTSANTLTYVAENTAMVSVEAFFLTGSSLTSQSLCEFNDSSAGTSDTSDKAVYFDSSNRLVFYIFDGAPKTATDTTTTYATNTLYHAIGVADGSNIYLYLNGRQVATAAAGSSFTGYTTPHFAMGAVRNGNLAANLASNVTMLLCGYANVAWTPAEIAARAADPFAFMQSPFNIVGRAPATFGSQNFFTMFPP